MKTTTAPKPGSVSYIYDRLSDTPVELRSTQKLRAKASAQVLVYVTEELRSLHGGDLSDDDRDIMDDWFLACSGWTLYGNAYDPDHSPEN